MPWKGLSPKQRTVLAFIAAYVKEHRWPPTLREICTHLGVIGTNGARDHVIALVRKGFLLRQPKIPRGLAITMKGYDALEQEDAA